MASKKPPIKNKILEDYLINSSHDLKSIGGLIVSGIVSTFGVYSVIRPFFTEGEVTNTATLNTALIAFVIVLIIFDTVKRGAFTKFFNSLLKKKIIESKVKKGYLVIAVFATMFMIMLDGLGSWSTAEKGANLYSQFKTNSSTEYQILQQNAESGKATAQNYTLELSAWKESKAEAITTCNQKWKGWKAKYKAKCKEEWNNANPMPKQTANGQIKIDDYKAIKKDGQGFLDEYLFTILFVLLSLMTLLMQYLTIAKIYDDYNDIEEGLTFERIEFINDTIQEHETILAEHEQKVAELMADSTREKKGKDRKFQEIGEAIAITHKQKMNDTRAETVKRIANNVYVPQEESKAGFVDIFSSSKEEPQINKLEVFNIEVDENGNAKQEIFKEPKVRGNSHFYFIKESEKWAIGGNDGYVKDWLKNIENNGIFTILGEHEQPLYQIRVKKYISTQSVKPNSYNQTVNHSVKPNEEKEPIKQTPNQSVNRTVITERFNQSLFTKEELKLITILWGNGKVKPHDSLVTRKEVLETIGDTKLNTTLLRNLYKKLLEYNYIYKRVGYFAKVEV